MVKPPQNKRDLLFLPFVYSSILFSCIPFYSFTILAEGTEATHITESHSNNEKDTSYTGAVLKEEFATECLWLACDQTTALATRQETPLSKAPSIVTVITAEEIKNLGYRTFIEILRTVPGFEILKRGDLGISLPVVRGVQCENRVRVMVNGHFTMNPARGGIFETFDDFPVENIKRIEIIRGPGSAVYGENAFLAVVNIITFDAKDIDGVKVSSGYGNFDTYDENITFGKTFGKLGISGMARYRQTNGFDGIIESDTQTLMDNALSSLGFPPASLAPGRIHDDRQEYDMELKATYDDFYFNGWYTNKRADTFIGPQYALTDVSFFEIDYVFGEVGYKKTFDESFTIRPRVYYDQFDADNYIKALPDGTTLPFDTDGDGVIDTFTTYPDGITQRLKVIERIVGTELPFDYRLFDGNIFTLGMEYRLINQVPKSASYNYNPETLEPLDSMQSFTDTHPFFEDHTRRILSFYLQDTWDITDTLNLTLGVRHDRYNDFGETTSPRAGLTWAFMKNASVKVLYGEAFRAPNFLEMFTLIKPSIQGNEDLDPERIRTYEVGLNYQFNKHVTSSINYFNNDIRDLIVLRALSTTQGTTRYENFGDAHVQGIETETKIDITKGNYVFMNYTFQNPEDGDGDDMPFVAQHFGNFGVNVHYWKYINTNLSTFVSGRRSREAGDPRDDLPSYALLNLSVIAKEFFKIMEVQGTVFNLLDKDYSDPGPISIPDDFPRPGRTFFVGLSYRF
ncbi:MAG: TonB-dependent receptor [Candidatus Brocadia sinica]|nr:MAG: TonB-dependent receptor [Candidatus Brocadia sinica]